MPFMPFQNDGIDFLTGKKFHKPHRLLGDEMGLGKTVQVCGAAKQLGADRIIIVCPKTVKDSWKRHLTGQVDPLWQVNNEEDVFVIRTGKDVIPDHTKTVIINPSFLVGTNNAMRKQLDRFRFDVCNIDEAHMLKSLDSEISQKVLGGNDPLISHAHHKWFTTGTWMPNRTMELYTILRTMAPEVIAPYLSRSAFGVQYCNGFESNNGFANTWDFSGASNEAEFNERLMSSGFYLRREIKDVHADLPPVMESEVFIDLGEMQHDETNTEQSTLHKIVGMTKLPFVVDHVLSLLDEIPKIVIFAFHREFIETLKHALWLKGRTATIVYGGQTDQQRSDAIRHFTEGDARVLIGQYNAAGTALDGLQHVCHHMVLAELDWSRGGTDQQIGRLRRHGQTRPVHVIRMIAEGTVNEAQVGVYYAKKRVEKAIFAIPQYTQHEEIQMSFDDNIERCALALEGIRAALETISGQATRTHAPDVSQVSNVKTEEAAVKQKAADKKAAEKKEKTVNGAEPASKEPAVTETVAAGTPAPVLKLDDVKAKAMEVVSRFAPQGSDGDAQLLNDALAKVSVVVKDCGADKLNALATQDQFVKALAGFENLLSPTKAKDLLSGV